MIISIDTNQDSKESIKKIIDFLQGHINEYSDSYVQRNNSLLNDSNNNLFGLFDNNQQSSESTPIKNQSTEDSSSIFRMFDDPQLKTDNSNLNQTNSDEDQETEESPKKQEIRVETY